ncbi:DNA primase [Lutimaribacter sp. EGI FJ00015]|uniref:DNA primase n=1 Tax=Lutimaribacter degradans TaxID=2945989 RepID=A0ACC5ZSE8_9RHOB|nr:DNA primase [Lutimaribacter sp. EGI FJ00013]MCM2560780.1 DNA primase [Lutimaribacter sp. EGI FJ00013]MCO0612274.1 DNA primase [Lutimaribacter sp. EGI FJ00015]MCO0634605.1 DNA primase [Lutimaribacter sp. EGI FJ00014]
MTRFTLAALCLAATSLPALAETGAERAARCAAQTEIVAQAVSLRTEGRRENRAIRQITRDRAGMDAPYTEAVSPLVGWVFALPDDQLESDVAGEFRAACDGFKP